MTDLGLSADELLSTTRTVRKRLDLTRPVERELILECLALAQQAPQPGNRQGRHFVVVTEPAQRAALGDIYRRALDIGYGGPPPREAAAAQALAERHRGGQPLADQVRILESVTYLYDHFQEVPVHVIPCIPALPEDAGPRGFATVTAWSSVMQSAWSFMLAARSRGLGTAWTTATLMFEDEVAELLGIPVEEYMQMGLIPVAHTKGTDFRAGPRPPLERVVHWNHW
jgi:nitroreductase